MEYWNGDLENVYFILHVCLPTVQHMGAAQGRLVAGVLKRNNLLCPKWEHLIRLLYYQNLEFLHQQAFIWTSVGDPPLKTRQFIHIDLNMGYTDR